MSREGDDMYRYPEGYPSDSDDPRSRPNERYENRRGSSRDRYGVADYSADAPPESMGHRPGADGDYGYHCGDRKHHFRDRAMKDFLQEEELVYRGDGRGRGYRGGHESNQRCDYRRFRDDRNYNREEDRYEGSGRNYDDDREGGDYSRSKPSYGQGGKSDDRHQTRKGGYRNEHDDRTDDFGDVYEERHFEDKYESRDYGNEYDRGQQNRKSTDEPHGESKYGHRDDNFGGGYRQNYGDGQRDYGSSNEDRNAGGHGGRPGRGGIRGRMIRGSNTHKEEGQRYGGFGTVRDSKGCFKCGGPHLARDCTEAPNEGYSRENRDSRGCFKCGGPHLARDCTDAPSRGAGQSRESGDSRGCFKCGGSHLARDCTEVADEGSGYSKDDKRKPVTYIPEDYFDDEDKLFSNVSKGINFDKYDNIPVEVTGTDPPKPINSFEECDIDERLKKNIRRAKYENPTPIQKWAIPIILKDRDLMGCAQTGSGKTAGFLLPVLNGMLADMPPESNTGPSPVALIVGPTRELVIQIYEETRKFSVGTNVRSVVVYGGVNVAHQASKIGRGVDVVIATVGRLLDFVRRGIIGLSRVRYLILDEADRMLDLGFKDDILSLCFGYDMPRKEDRQTLLFSATFPEDIQQIAATVLTDYVFVAVGRVGGANKDIQQTLELVQLNSKKERLIEILQSQPEETKSIVFVEKKVMSDFLAIVLCQNGLRSTSIHGDREQREREEALKTLKSGETPIIVATSVAARGLDVPGIGHVINYDLPKTADEYVHRIGRTGRCGHVGRATSFFDPATDYPLAQGLRTILAEAQQEVPSWLEDFCYSTSSYRQTDETSDVRYRGTGEGGYHDGGRKDGSEDRYGYGQGGEDGADNWK